MRIAIAALLSLVVMNQAAATDPLDDIWCVGQPVVVFPGWEQRSDSLSIQVDIKAQLSSPRVFSLSPVQKDSKPKRGSVHSRYAHR